MFNTFDIQGSGQITKENIKDAFTKFGKELSDDEVD
jgi:Ca2+-binding EF-hand superfamily protein